VSLDLAFDDGQQAVADAVAQLCADRCDDAVVKAMDASFPHALWQELAELGVLGVLSPDEEGGALEAVAAIEALGRAVFPGPLVATFVASRLLDGSDRDALASGEQIACLGEPPLWPWGCDADFLFEIHGDRISRAAPRGSLSPVPMYGGETWGRGEVERQQALEGGADALVLARLLRAAQLAAMGRRLIDDAGEHAATRKQFGRPIGDFQAVAHPLAECAIRLESAATLARAAAFHFDAGDGREAARFAAAAHVSACEAAIDASHVGHQAFGAIGITTEGPVFHVSRRIRQLAAEAPTRDSSATTLLRDVGFGDAA
jgi:hypothetical protein